MNCAAHHRPRSHQRQKLLRGAKLKICRDVPIEIIDHGSIHHDDLSHLLRMSSVLQEKGGSGTKTAYVQEVRIHEQTDQGHRIIWLIQNIGQDEYSRLDMGRGCIG